MRTETIARVAGNILSGNEDALSPFPELRETLAERAVEVAYLVVSKIEQREAMAKVFHDA